MKKKLLQPCIALASSVVDRGDAQTQASVDIDCLTFDRVLLYLEVRENVLLLCLEVRENVSKKYIWFWVCSPGVPSCAMSNSWHG